MPQSARVKSNKANCWNINQSIKQSIKQSINIHLTLRPFKIPMSGA